MKDNVILGIDPGTIIMGYGILQVKGKQMELLSMGAVHMQKMDNHPLKLKRIFDSTLSLIKEYKPDELAIEAPFFGKNVQSMLKLGRAQGVAIAAALSMDLPVFEYLPKKIKQSITGNGNASKEQVAKMLQQLLKIETFPKNLDASDGLAAAVCHSFQGPNTAGGSKKFSNWKSFLLENPNRQV